MAPIWITVPSGQVIVMGGGVEPSGISIVVVPPTQIVVPGLGATPGGHWSPAGLDVVEPMRTEGAAAAAGRAPIPNEPIITPTTAVHHRF